MKDEVAAPRLRFDRGEISGSLGDLGTFLPLTLGYITRCGVFRQDLFSALRLTVWSPFLVLPRPADWVIGFTKGAVAQLPLTLLNSVVAVCALSDDLFPGRKVPETTMARSVGVMNLVSCWFGGGIILRGAKRGPMAERLRGSVDQGRKPP
jgi:hypothetical protein